MQKKITALWILLCVVIFNISIAVGQYEYKVVYSEKTKENITYDFSFNYGLQWEMNFGSNNWYGARYEGPQPIGDCDDDGRNELLIGGRDDRLRIFEWNETKQTYFEMHNLHCPYYPFVSMSADGFAIGDLTGDGKNEIAVSWYATLHKWVEGKYETLSFSTWLENNGGGNPDCYIGDCDNDGKNEYIMSCRPWRRSVPEIVVFEWDGLQLIKESEWDDPGVDGHVFMAGMGDVDEDGENEIVCGSANKVVVLDWNKVGKEFEATIIKKTQGWEDYPFACVCKDSDMDGKNEIHVGYYSPEITIFEWNGVEYVIKFEKEWPGEGALIEGLDVGDVDDDGIAEVCAGTDVVHILQWNGTTYVEEAELPTFGELAVVSIGDCDNDGKNEIHAGSVMIDYGQEYMSWVYKYGLEPNNKLPNNQRFKTLETTISTGDLRVNVKNTRLGIPLNSVSVAAWNIDTKTWYDIQAVYTKWGSYYRSDLPVGEYLLRVTLEDYQSQEATVAINNGEETSYTFSLQPVSTRIKDITIVKHSSNILFFQMLKKFIDYFSFLKL